ncbi:hypothetical protein, partial [Mucilaginibacter sp. BT774]|uniref:hypothetical protein n=1 Tax=Mucilaginibacter sp. BT774 TaxID=3062276 RepID=UPI002676EC4B
TLSVIEYFLFFHSDSFCVSLYQDQTSFDKKSDGFETHRFFYEPNFNFNSAKHKVKQIVITL